LFGNSWAPAANIEVVDSDSEVIRRSMSSPVSFGELFDRHFQQIFQFCARRIGPSLAEDVAGETFRRAFEARGRYDDSYIDARPWLFGIARNIMRNDARRAVREAAAYKRLSTFDTSNGDDPAELAVGVVAAREDLARLREALLAMDAEDLEPLLLHVWDRLSYEQVAQVIGVPVGTVRSRIHRIRLRLAAPAVDDVALAASQTPPTNRRS
jgi:RNA polymerase sigma factor (sigma-70 family)